MIAPIVNLPRDRTAFDRRADHLWLAFLPNRETAARDELVMHYLGMAISAGRRVALAHKTAHRSMGEDDLTQEGAIVLMRLIELWRPDYGVPFTSYAASRLYPHIQARLRSDSLVKRSGLRAGVRIRMSSLDAAASADSTDTIGQTLIAPPSNPLAALERQWLRRAVVKQLLSRRYPRRAIAYAMQRFFRGRKDKAAARWVGRTESWGCLQRKPMTAAVLAALEAMKALA